MSEFIPKHKLPTPQMTRIWMRVNGELKQVRHRADPATVVMIACFAERPFNFAIAQDESTSDMVFSIAHLVSYISHFMTLEPGDVILTGTPAGPCPLRPGDVVECGLDSVHCALQLKFPVEAAPSS